MLKKFLINKKSYRSLNKDILLINSIGSKIIQMKNTSQALKITCATTDNNITVFSTGITLAFILGEKEKNIEILDFTTNAQDIF